MEEKKEFSRQAFNCLQVLKKAADECNGGIVATKSACIYGNLETAFYEKEIDLTTRDMFKTRTDMLIAKFNTNCRCFKK